MLHQTETCYNLLQPQVLQLTLKNYISLETSGCFLPIYSIPIGFGWKMTMNDPSKNGALGIGG